MENIKDSKNQEIVLEYPCDWKYSVVVGKDADIDEILKPILENRIFKLKPSKTSKDGTYISYSLGVLVHNDEDRVCLYENIRSHESVKIVL